MALRLMANQIDELANRVDRLADHVDRLPNHVLLYWLFLMIGCLALAILVSILWQAIREWWS